MITATQSPSPSAPTIEQDAHLAAAAYLMEHAGTTALVVLEDEQSKRPIGLINKASLVEALGSKDVNDVRVRDVMTAEMTSGNASSSPDAFGS